jgi:hypothetical protein
MPTISTSPIGPRLFERLDARRARGVDVRACSGGPTESAHTAAPSGIR